jgi:hypothetical protein
MNAAVTAPPAPAETEPAPRESWSRPRWIFYVTLAFAVHIGLIFAFGNRKPVEPRAVVKAPAMRFTTGRSELQALADPTLFALPHPHGFAAASWLQLPRIEFAPFRWTEPPQLMTLPAAKLATAFLRYAQANDIPRPELETLPPPGLTQLEVPEQPTALKQHSQVRVNGDLANRRWLNAPALLRSWPATDLLTNSLVQVLTDADGQILSAVLLPPGSGAKVADQRALELARSARFAPFSRNGDRLTMGTIIFEWHTVPCRTRTPRPPNPDVHLAAHLRLRGRAARGVVRAHNLFGNAPSSFPSGGERRPYFSLREMRPGLHRRPGRGPLTLFAMRKVERGD